MSQRPDVQQAITDRIVATIEAGAGEFQMPWHRSSQPLTRPRNAHTGKLYRGVNILNLWIAAEAQGFSTATWATYKQWQERGAQVRGGQRSTTVVVFKEFHVEPQADNPDDDGKRLFARASHVFNADQVEGWQGDEASAPVPDHGPIARIAAADAFTRGCGATICSGGQRAYYTRQLDYIQMPDEKLFIGDAGQRSEAYYSVLLHELTHWSGAPKRLDREFGKRFGDKAYAFEELVAELGAAFLCATLGISNEPRRDHAQYIAHWLAILKGDKRAIFTAASKASAAADYLDGLAHAPALQAAA